MLKGTGVLKRYAPLVSVLTRALDVVLCVAGGLLAYGLRFGFTGTSMPVRYSELMLLGALLVLIVFPLVGVYQSWRSGSLLRPAARAAVAWLAVFLLLLIFLVVIKQAEVFSRGWLAWWFVCVAGLVIVLRLAAYLTLQQLRRRGHNRRHVVIVGDRTQAWRLVRAVQHTVWSGFELDRVFSVTGGGVLEGVEKAPLATLGEWVAAHPPDEVWITLSLEQSAELHAALEQLRHCAANIRYAPDLFGLFLLNHGVTEVLSVPMLDLTASPIQGGSRLVKELEDRVLAALILVLISPVLLLIAIGVKLSSPGPVYYRQERVGWNGKLFQMLKFRSMPVDAEALSGAVWANRDDQRVTWFGRFLRRTSLDELPQFFNVLKGEMSIVGPRPERPVFVERFKQEIPGYMQKHMVKAGITGWAQVNGWRGRSDLDRRIEHDLYYIENWSLWLDLKIIFLTLFKGFVNRNAY